MIQMQRYKTCIFCCMFICEAFKILAGTLSQIATTRVSIIPATHHDTVLASSASNCVHRTVYDRLYHKACSPNISKYIHGHYTIHHNAQSPVLCLRAPLLTRLFVHYNHLRDEKLNYATLLLSQITVTIFLFIRAQSKCNRSNLLTTTSGVYLSSHNVKSAKSQFVIMQLKELMILATKDFELQMI